MEITIDITNEEFDVLELLLSDGIYKFKYMERKNKLESVWADGLTKTLTSIRLKILESRIKNK